MRNLRRARRVVADVRELALASRTRGTGAVRMPLSKVMNDVLPHVRERGAEAGVRLEVMEPYPEVQVDGARVEIILQNLLSNGGSGLGLSIVLEAIRQLGSNIEVESVAGEGTTFRFRVG